jgi:hypothetical protein
MEKTWTIKVENCDTMYERKTYLNEEPIEDISEALKKIASENKTAMIAQIKVQKDGETVNVPAVQVTIDTDDLFSAQGKLADAYGEAYSKPVRRRRAK